MSRSYGAGASNPITTARSRAASTHLFFSAKVTFKPTGSFKAAAAPFQIGLTLERSSAKPPTEKDRTAVGQPGLIQDAL